MRPRTGHRLLLLSFFVAAGLPVRGAAQVEAHLDAAAAYVKYDGYLGSGAASLTPSVAWQSPRATLAARGTVLAFESGNTSLQGFIAAGAFSPSYGPLRLEANAEAGASAYAQFAHFAHLLGEVQAHVMAERWGVYAGPLIGSASSGAGPHAVAGVAAGLWGRAGLGALEARWTSIVLGDTTFGDLQARGRLRAVAVDVEAVVGLRTTSPGAGSAGYADLSVAARLTEWLSLVLSGGNYPSDPVRGTIPGRFFSAGFRLTALSRPSLAVVPQLASRPAPETGGVSSWLAGASASVGQVEGFSMLMVRAAGARRVDVMGDFTGWEPVALTRVSDGPYVCPVALPSGVHRFNVRLDGGPWGVPRGVAVATDEYGGSVGVLVVP